MIHNPDDVADLRLNRENTDFFKSYLDALNKFVFDNPENYTRIGVFHKSLGICGNCIKIGMQRDIFAYFRIYMDENDIILLDNNYNIRVLQEDVSKAYDLGLHDKLLTRSGAVVGDDYWFRDNLSRIPFVKFIIEKYGCD